MEQLNRLGALGYLPPLLLHALLLFVADGERGNFAASGGSGESLLGPPEPARLGRQGAGGRREGEGFTVSSNPGVQSGPRGVGGGAQRRVAAAAALEPGSFGAGQVLGLRRGGLRGAGVGAPQPGSGSAAGRGVEA